MNLDLKFKVRQKAVERLSKCSHHKDAKSNGMLPALGGQVALQAGAMLKLD